MADDSGSGRRIGKHNGYNGRSKRSHHGRGKQGHTGERGSNTNPVMFLPKLRKHNQSLFNIDTWKSVCYWLSTPDLMGLFMTGNRKIQYAVTNVHDHKWDWYYYPVFELFKHIHTVNLSWDKSWSLLPSIIANLPTTIKTLKLSYTPKTDQEDQRIVLPSSLTSLDLEMDIKILANVVQEFPPGLTDLTIRNSESTTYYHTSTVHPLLSMLPVGLLHLKLTGVGLMFVEDVSALPQTLESLKVCIDEKYVALLPCALQRLTLTTLCHRDYAYLALLPPTLKYFKHIDTNMSPSEEGLKIFKRLPTTLTQLHISYPHIHDTAMFARYPLQELILSSNDEQAVYRCGTDTDGNPILVPTALTFHSNISKHPGYGSNYILPNTVQSLTLTRDDDITRHMSDPYHEYQFTSLECAIWIWRDTITMFDTKFFTHITVLTVADVTCTDNALQILSKVNRTVLRDLSMSGSFRVNLGHVMHVICGTHNAYVDSTITRNSVPFNLRSLTLGFMENIPQSIKLQCYNYHQKFELPIGLESFTVTGFSTFHKLIFPRSLTYLSLDKIMVKPVVFARTPRLRILVWKVHTFGPTELQQLQNNLPSKLRILALNLDLFSGLSISRDDQEDFYKYLGKNGRDRYLTSISITYRSHS